MDDLCVVSKRKYKFMCVMVVVLPAVAILLMGLLFATIGAWIADYRPQDGVWYCEELGMEANFADGKKTMTTADGEVLYIRSYYNRIEIIRILDDTTAADEDGRESEEVSQETVCYFDAVKLKKNRWVLRDRDGNDYVFVRK